MKGDGLGQYPRQCHNPDCQHGGKIKLTGHIPLCFQHLPGQDRQSFHFECWVAARAARDGGGPLVGAGR